MSNEQKDKNKQERPLTVASIVARGSTCACIGYAVGWWITDDITGSLIGLIIGYIIGTFLKNIYF